MELHLLSATCLHSMHRDTTSCSNVQRLTRMFVLVLLQGQELPGDYLSSSSIQVEVPKQFLPAEGQP